jgi:hypothetical protein
MKALLGILLLGTVGAVAGVMASKTPGLPREPCIFLGEFLGALVGAVWGGTADVVDAFRRMEHRKDPPAPGNRQ